MIQKGQIQDRKQRFKRENISIKIRENIGLIEKTKVQVRKLGLKIEFEFENKEIEFEPESRVENKRIEFKFELRFENKGI